MRLWLVVLGLVTGCYAELGGYAYPFVRTTSYPADPAMSPTTTSGAGFGLSIKLGFYLDIPIRSLRSAIGVGVGAVGSDAIRTNGGGVTPRPVDVRVDVATRKLVAGFLQTRITGIYGPLNGASVRNGATEDYTSIEDADGYSAFLGASLAGKSESGTLVMASFGVQHHDASVPASGSTEAIDITSTGVGVRLLVNWTPGLGLLKYHKPEDPSRRSIDPARGAGCGYREVCRDGNCRSQYYCP